MGGGSTQRGGPGPEARRFYARTLASLNTSGIPFLVGGAYALQRYTDIGRHTKDFDLFVRRDDRDRIMQALDGQGCRTEATFSHWLAKAYRGDHFFDVIFSSGNGLASVDDDWFAHSVEDRIFGVPVRLVPIEEMIWQKAFIMERERFDGADIAHLIHARSASIDWTRLLRRFEGAHGRLLLAHLILFGYIYPGERARIPVAVVRKLIAQLDDDEPVPGPSGDRLCRGPLLSRAQYLSDIGWWGYKDARLPPYGPMTAEEIAHWTAAIAKTP